jgi:hypothetical protein
MEPIDKAKEVIGQYWHFVNDYTTISKPTDNHISVIYEDGQQMGRAKQCALIAVQMVQTNPNIRYDHDQDESQYDYWQKVKEEIQKF